MASSADRSAGPRALAPMRPHVSFRSRDLERAVDFLYGKDLNFNVTREHAPALDVRISGVYLPGGLYIGLTEYGARASIQASPRRDDYWLLIPVRGQMETAVHRHQYVSDPHHAFLFSYPSMGPSRIDVDTGASRIMVVLTHASLRRQLAALLGKPVDVALYPPLEFAPVVDLTSGPGRTIAALARCVVASFEHGCPIAANSIALASFEQFIVNELLLSHPHNYSDEIYGTQPSIGPGDVKRALDYLESHLEESVTMADLVAASQVPGRTLFQHFRDFKGMSPMRYLREARLQHVHRQLLAADPEESITEVATNWGFTHLGRFAVDYRRRFGERPSDTLRRRSHKA
jgi:AraC-like DNA-binding protein